jgi:hypothetical protein
MTLPQPSGSFSQEEFLDMLAYILATNPLTSNIQWILGDVGMGAPGRVPFGYIATFNEAVQWYTAAGRASPGGGGIAAGVDDWAITVVMTIAFTPHEWFPPQAATPPLGSPFNAVALGSAPPYFEQPTFRVAIEINENVKAVLRTNITMGGEVATTRVVESRYLLQDIDGKQYRVCRITVAAQQRRARGR